MSAWETFVSIAPYVAYTSFIFMGGYLFMIVMWLFATDFYDKFKNENSDGLGMFNMLLVLSILNAVAGMAFTWENPFNYFLNAFICVVIVIFVVSELYDYGNMFHHYCKRKRGK